MTAAALALVALLAGQAEAERLEVWTPSVGPRPFAAGPLELSVVRWRGDRLVPVGALEATSDIGTVVVAEGGDPFVRRVVLVPPPRANGTATLRARAGDLEATLPIALDDSVMGQVVVRADPRTFVKGKDQGEVTLFIDTLAADGEPAGDVAPRLFTNTGTTSAARLVAPGRFTATYRPSDAPYPEVAVVVALLPWPHEASATVAVGQTVIPQPAAIDLPGETRPRVEMTVRIADDEFGPVRADDKGRFQVPIVVPPGVGSARGVSRDRFGNRRSKSIDLRLPPTQRLALAAHPRELVADGASHALIVLTALEPTGAPDKSANPTLTAARGQVSGLHETRPGLFHAWYVAPADVGDGTDVLTAGLARDSTSKAELPIRLSPGAPVRVELEVPVQVVEAPSQQPVILAPRFFDARDQLVPDVSLRATAKWGVLDPDGGQLAYFPPGSARPGKDRLVIRGFARSERAAVRLALSPPSTLVAVDAVGRPVPGARVVSDGNSTFADAEGRVTLPARSGVIQVELPGAALPTVLHLALGEDDALHGAPSVPATLEREVSLTLLTPRPVRVFAEVTQREAARAEVRYEVTGADGPVTFLVDGVPVARERARKGARWVDAARDAVLSVAHPPSGAATALLPAR